MVPREVWSQMQATVDFTESRQEECAELRGKPSPPPWWGFLEASGLPSGQPLPSEQPRWARLSQWASCWHRAPWLVCSNPSNGLWLPDVGCCWAPPTAQRDGKLPMREVGLSCSAHPGHFGTSSCTAQVQTRPQHSGAHCSARVPPVGATESPQDPVTRHINHTAWTLTGAGLLWVHRC